MAAEIEHTPPDFSYSVDSAPTDIYDVRKFYDPTDKFRDDALPVFLGRVAATRAVDVKMMIDGRMQDLRPREVMAAELTHALIDMPVELAAGNDATERGIQEVITATHEYADLVATTAVQLAEQIKKNKKSKESILVLAAKILAATAHEKQKRKSGLQYIEHPDRAASLFEIAWRRHIPQEEETEESKLLLDIHRAHIYLHDGYEDSIDPTGEYLSQDKEEHLTVSPLILKKVLEKCNILPPEGFSQDDIARTPLYMTRQEGFDGEKDSRLSYNEYADAGMEWGGPFFIAAKVPDTADNAFIEPPEDPNKIKKYTDLITPYKKEASKYGAQLGKVVRTIFELKREDVRKFKPDGFELKHIPTTFKGAISNKMQARRRNK